jgi:hypothetical protein
VKSLIQDTKECYVCKTTLDLHLHHIFYGTANRKISDKDGCVVYLCERHHTGIAGVHNNTKTDLTLKQRCEAAWLCKYDKTVEDFIRRYGKNYL